MGLYDRDYGRDEPTAWDRIENPRSITITLIVITAAAFLIEILFTKNVSVALPNGLQESVRTHPIVDWLAVAPDALYKPWLWWQFLSYGFLHDPKNIFHLVFNMIGLFFFGRIMEQRLGRMEFLRFYLVAIVIGGIVAALTGVIMIAATGTGASTIGASGAVVATVILFACNFPHEQIHVMGVLPIKAWVVAAVYVASDTLGAIGVLSGVGSASNTAFTVHLAGAAFAAAYFFQRWNLRWLASDTITQWPARMRQRSRRMKLKLHDPDRKIEKEARDADQILEKIHAHGESSLTAAERKTLERYSRRQREKRNQ